MGEETKKKTETGETRGSADLLQHATKHKGTKKRGKKETVTHTHTPVVPEEGEKQKQKMGCCFFLAGCV